MATRPIGACAKLLHDEAGSTSNGGFVPVASEPLSDRTQHPDLAREHSFFTQSAPGLLVYGI